MSKISLTTSMKSNLLSLQNITKQQDKTAINLSTGQKVNSAIDNPSAYYTAQSLSHRASDLSALLDTMEQAIQTIKAATTTLETGAELLGQATAIAAQVQEVPLEELPKSWFETQAHLQNGVVVSNAEELKAVVKQTTNPPEIIVIYGKIDINLDDPDFNRSIELKDNQKLVGTEYFGNINKNALYRSYDNKRMSELNIATTTGRVGIRALVACTTISDLTINSYGCGQTVELAGGSETSYIHNVDISNDKEWLSQCISVFQSSLIISGEINLRAAEYSSARVINNNGGNVVIDGNLNFLSEKGNFVWSQGDSVTTLVTERTRICVRKNFPWAAPLTISQGAKLGLLESDTWVEFAQDYITSPGYQNITQNFITRNPEKFSFTKVWEKYQDHTDMKILAEGTDNLLENYNYAIMQYDSLINDGSYKGINLLNNESLLIGFNEDKSSFLNVKGEKMSSEAIGVKTKDWQKKEDVMNSLSEIASALNSIRSFQTELGNNYSIISTRQNFTKNLINVLEEGADKLTLADMNEESANMLALQTRQRLAVNSLSLASQASQAVLKLF